MTAKHAFIGFGPYPLSTNWQKDGRKEDHSFFLPPDEDNFDKHGRSNLLIKYSEFSGKLKLDKYIHKDSPFFKRNMLDGVLDRFLDELNEHLEPIKDEIQNLDRFAF